MIRKLQHRFIRIALAALGLAMLLVVAAINSANWVSVRRELDETLSFLAENSAMNREDLGRHMTGKNRHDRNRISESSWFSVTVDSGGTIRNMNLLNLAEPDRETASALTEEALRSKRESGMIQDFLYRVRENPSGGKTVLLLNCETRLAAVRTLALISLLACVAGILLAFLVVSLASRKAIEPIIRNMEQQKQFITNASHELKTPLTVIATNMELLQMEQPDSQWVRSTRKQTAQMQHLVEELVYLSRMEEENAPLERENINLSALLRETAEPFAAMAEYRGRELRIEAEDPVTVRGDRASVQRLMSTLLDNAVKYASGEEPIRVKVRGEGRHAVMTVSNGVDRPLTGEQCRQLFDRFYRADPSRNKEKQNGFGIGLAIAAAVVEKHGGTLTAETEGSCLVFTCRLPRGGSGA